MSSAYAGTSRYIAFCLQPNSPNQIDVWANDRSDYEAELAIKAWMASSRYRAEHITASVADEQSYVFKSLWRDLGEYLRRRNYREKHDWQFIAKDDVGRNETFLAYEEKECLDSRLEARDLMNKLMKVLSVDEIELALRMGESWKPGVRTRIVNEVYDPEKDNNRKALSKRMERLRDKVKVLFPEFNMSP